MLLIERKGRKSGLGALVELNRAAETSESLELERSKSNKVFLSTWNCKTAAVRLTTRFIVLDVLKNKF
jgi:hypothetical protein